MHLEKPETVWRALEILAKAGGTLDGESFARQFFPANHPGWKRTVGKSGKKLGGGLFRASGALLGHLRNRDWLVAKVGVGTWKLTDQGWARFRAGVAAPPPRTIPTATAQPRAATPPAAPQMPQGALLGWAGGQWFPLRAAVPYGSGWYIATWANGAQTILPETGLRRQA